MGTETEPSFREEPKPSLIRVAKVHVAAAWHQAARFVVSDLRLAVESFSAPEAVITRNGKPEAEGKWIREEGCLLTSEGTMIFPNKLAGDRVDLVQRESF